jgi:hypothetical protein
MILGLPFIFFTVTKTWFIKVKQPLNDFFLKVLIRFANWFSSSGGVWQTVIFATIVTTLEQIFPRLDPHGFWLLYYLTIYSAITQPALAFIGRQSSIKSQESLDQLQKLNTIFITKANADINSHIVSYNQHAETLMRLQSIAANMERHLQVLNTALSQMPINIDQKQDK